MGNLRGTVCAVLCLIGLIAHTIGQDPNCPEEYGYFADPSNMAAFYQCDRGISVWVECANGTLFDSTVGNCIATETHVSTHGIVCPEPDGLFQLSGDCSRFLACVNNVAHVMDCPEGTLYNRIQQWCGEPENSSC
ncbi:hypothetical protein SNE40_001997 [Patella caerulea]|uniref:Chitin-binding type-2 domain-containing protein n=1 Tax=Patella caerulea TaxID=87958 RepID=A0AAN8Q2E2_PATCE